MADLDIQIVTDIEGLDELEEAFLNGSPRVVRQFLQRVHRRAGSILVESAKANAPYQTGDLEGDIHTQTITSKDGMTTRVGPSKKTFWGLIQEVGSAEANVPPQHWLEQAAVEVQDQVLDEYQDALDDGLRQMKGGK